MVLCLPLFVSQELIELFWRAICDMEKLLACRLILAKLKNTVYFSTENTKIFY